MLRTKDPNQSSFMDPLDDFSPKRRKRLETSWAQFFRHHVLPELPVKQVYPYFSEFGRPSKELYTSLGVLILQQTFDYSDQDTLSQLAFNTQWHHALNIAKANDDSTYMCEKTLYNIRNVILQNDLWNTLFDEVTDSLIAQFDVNTDKQRLDSTHIKSNMKSLGRIGLFSQTLHKFLTNLKRQHRSEFDSLSEKLKDSYLGSKQLASFSLVKPSESTKTLKKLSKDLYYLIRRFESHPEIQRMKSFALLRRVFNEQCQLVENTKFKDQPLSVEPKPAKQVPSDSLQNPSDPDATYNGHKGKGYQVQIMETFSEEETKTKPNLITYVDVEQAHCHDSKALKPAIEATEKRNIKPKELLADSLYGNDENTTAAKQHGVDLVSPSLIAATKRDKLHLSDFSFNGKHHITHCPNGKKPLSQQVKKQDVLVKFHLNDCQQCPLRERCPVKDAKKNTYIRYTPKDARLALRRNHEKTPAFINTYAYRAGIEGTISQYKRSTGAGNLRVRGLKPVSYSATMKALGVNILRSTKAFFAPVTDPRGLICASVKGFIALFAYFLAFFTQKGGIFVTVFGQLMRLRKTQSERYSKNIHQPEYSF
jgi:hypothetical protein